MRISDWSSDVCSSDLKACPRWLCQDVEYLLSCWSAFCISAVQPTSQQNGVRVHAQASLEEVALRRRCNCRSERRPECQRRRSEEHTSELQSLMRISYAVFCLKKKKIKYKSRYRR